MAFNVNFWTFSKKERSTAQPTGTGTVYSCTANEPLDLLAPVISLKLALNTSSPPTVYNYARIANFSRYYWVTGWEIRDGLWWASLRVDALASWKSQIGSSSVYVYRSSFSYSLRLTDSMYPQLVTPRRLTVSLPKCWTVGGANDPGDLKNSCTIVAGIVSGNSTKYYAFAPAQWRIFYTALFSQAYYNAVLGEFGATEYPEAKVAINPLQYITSALLIPWGIGASRFQIDYVSAVNSIMVGNVSVTGSPTAFTAYSLTDEISDPWTWYVQIGSDFWHPQADARGDWLNYSPFTEYLLFFPPVGEIPLDPAIVAGSEYIRFYMYTDFKSGTGMLEVIADYGSSKTRILTRVEFSLGSSIQLSNVLTPGVNAANQAWYDMASDMTGALGGMGSAFNQLKKIVPVAGSMWENGIQSAIHGSTPHLSTSGKFGSLASMGGSPRIDVTQWYLAGDDLNDKGRPLCEIRQISAIPGYITGDPDSLAIACTDPELSDIRNSVASGFYYE